ncbi:MAG TPA: Ig-like domain-containing protein [Cyclobacteriaceae bacterium]|nr:Ig-like domain-containing protein [Cyclobacteriaceae bacterium]
MKRFLPIFTILLALAASPVFAQRGKIIRSASTSVMDPNGDGFISKTTAGFSNDGYNVDEFEITMFGIPKLGGDVTGDNIGADCGITDLIPDNKGFSSYAVRDGNNNLIFRFRVGDDNPSVEAWTILLDTDGLFGPDDPNATPENPGFEIDITLIKRNNAGVYVYNIDGIESCPTELLYYSIDSNFQISIADEVTCGDPDYFYDYYVPFADIANALGINLNTGLRYVAVTNVSATCAMAGKIADVSGIDNNDPEYSSCLSCGFVDLVSNQCPTAVVDLCETCPGFAQDLVHAPTIDEPIRAGQTVISGTCDSAIFIVVKVFQRVGGTDAAPIWSTTPRETKSSYAIDTLWSVTLSNPLIGFDKIVARAQSDEFSVPCGGDDDQSSSTSITVVAPNTKPVADDQVVSAQEDTPANITLTGSDPENDVITYIVVTGPAHGTLSGTAPNLVYTPNLNYNGPDNFTFKTNDDIFDSDPVGTVTITVTPVNDAPIANNQSVNVTEDIPQAITLVGSDVDGNPLTYTVGTAPTHGVLTGTAPNLTYTPELNYNGLDSFTFTVNDGTVDSAPATVTINVIPVPDPPVADDQVVAVIEDTPKPITLTGSDPDANALTYSIITGPSQGTLSGTAPNLTYIPNLNFNGGDSFTFSVNDGTSNSNTATVTITVAPVNDAPVADNQSVPVTEDVAKAITLTGSDVDGNPLTYSVVAGPTNGVLTGIAPNLTYTPNLNFNGSDSFTFKVNDGTVDSNIATVFLTIAAADDAPIADDQTIPVSEDVPTPITLTGSDPDGSALTYSVDAIPTHGTLSGTAPNLTYTPDLNYNGGDSFTFKVNDGTTDSNIATVTINVTPVNDDPIANSQNATFDLNTPKAITLTGSDIDGDPLTFTVLTQPANGVLSGTEPNVTYTPNNGFTGSDSFTFHVNDGTTDSNTATVSLNLTPVTNTPPVAHDQDLPLAQEDTPTPIILSATDIDGDVLTYTIVTPPSHGTLSGTGPNIIYTPASNYSGSDSFVFKVNDGNIDSNDGTVTISVNAVNDAPIASNQSLTTDEDVPLPITLAASDIEGNTLTYSIVTAPTKGSLSGSGQNITYTPSSNFTGSDSFSFRVNDGSLNSNTATVFIAVNPVQDAPIADNATVTVQEDAPKSFTLTGSDPDGNSLTYNVLSSPTNGTLSGTAPNLTYTPALNFTGSDSFTFRVNDGTLNSNVATVSITVDPVNDLPVAINQSVSTGEEVQKAITLTGGDVDGDLLTFTILTQPTHGTLIGTGANITYTPALNYNGGDSFTFKVNDGTIDSNTGVVSINVTPTNDQPVADNQIISTLEDVAKVITLTGSDIDGDAITYAVVTNPTNGVLTGTGSNLTYTPNANFNGADSFTFKTNDGTVDSEIATVTIGIMAVADLPVADNQSVTTDEDVAKNITLTASNPDGNTLTYILVTVPLHGTLTGSGQNVTYIPVENYNGPDNFTFKVNDGISESNTATISITVTPVNDPPKISFIPDVFVREDSLLQVCLNVVDIDNEPITFEAATNVKGAGTMVRDVAPYDFCYIFRPPANINGESVWNLLVTDAGGLTGTGSVKIIILPVNDPPVGIDDYIDVPATKLSTIDVISNDLPIAAPYKEFYDIYEADSIDVLKLDAIIKQSVNGTTNIVNGMIDYTPFYGFIGADSVVYRVCDSGRRSLCDTATLFINVEPAEFKIYQGFSPNGDGNNDYWRIDGVEVEPYKDNFVQVFDRFNNLVFEKRNYNNTEGNSWKGESNHGLVKGGLPEGTYFYHFRLDNGQTYSGFVVLKRQ